jgi:hypothetical protein
MSYNNLMSNTAMTTPTPLNRPRNTRPQMSNQRIPRVPINNNLTNTLPPAVLAQARKIAQPSLQQSMPANILAPQMPQMNQLPMMPQTGMAQPMTNQALAPAAQPFINPITGQEMTEEEYQQMFGQMMPPGMSSNQLMPQPQQTGLQSVATQPRIF